MDMNATHRSSRCTNVPRISPAMMRLKMVVMSRMYAPPNGSGSVGTESLSDDSQRLHPVPPVLHSSVPVHALRSRQRGGRRMAAWRTGCHGLGRRVAGTPAEPDERVRQDVRSDGR